MTKFIKITSQHLTINDFIELNEFYLKICNKIKKVKGILYICRDKQNYLKELYYLKEEIKQLLEEIAN